METVSLPQELPASRIPVSVVIPCFNCAVTLLRAIDSVARQVQLPQEVILIDDGSSDGTLALLHHLWERFPDWIVVVALGDNRGAASARNAGWAAAGGSHIAFLDADDSWHPEKLAMQYRYMSEHPTVAVSGHQCHWLQGVPPSLSGHAPDVTSVSGRSLLFRNAFSTPTAMVKRDVPFRFAEGRRYAEDLRLWQQIAFADLMVVRIEAPLAYIHKAQYGAGGLSAQMWAMEAGELDNLSGLFKEGKIDVFTYLVASGFSVLKFSRRMMRLWLMNVLPSLSRVGK